MPVTGVLLFAQVLAIVLLSTYPGLNLIANGIGFVLVLVFIVELLVRRINLHFPLPVIFFGLFLCFCVLQMVWAPGSTTMLLTLIQLWILTFLVCNYCIICRSDHIIELAVYSAVICTFLYIIIANPGASDGRVGSTLINQNAYSYVLLIGVLFILRRMLLDGINPSGKAKHAVACVAFLGASVYGVVYLAGSRDGIVVTIVCIGLVSAYWVWCQPFRRRIWVATLAILVFVGLGYAVYRSPSAVRLVPVASYLQGESVSDSSMLKREGMMKTGIDLWLERPFTGWGVDQFRVVSGFGTYSHNNYVELLTNGGLVGLLLSLLVPASACAYLVRSWRLSLDRRSSAEAYWGIVVLAAMAAFDLAGVTYYNKFHWVTIAVVVALATRKTTGTGRRVSSGRIWEEGREKEAG